MTARLILLAFCLVFSATAFSQDTDCAPPASPANGGFRCEEEARPAGLGRVFIFHPPASVADYFEVSGTMTLAPTASNVPAIPNGGSEPFLRMLSSENGADLHLVQAAASPLAVSGLATRFSELDEFTTSVLPPLFLNTPVSPPPTLDRQTVSFSVIWRKVNAAVENYTVAVYINGALYREFATFDARPAPVRLGRLGDSAPSSANSMRFVIHRAH